MKHCTHTKYENNNTPQIDPHPFPIRLGGVYIILKLTCLFGLSSGGCLVKSPGRDMLLADRPPLFITLRLLVCMVTGLSSWANLATLGAELERFMTVYTHKGNLRGGDQNSTYTVYCLFHLFGMQISYMLQLEPAVHYFHSQCVLIMYSIWQLDTLVKLKLAEIHRMQWRIW